MDKMLAKYHNSLVVMAHDIKAPLTSVVSLLKVITKGYVTDVDKMKDLVGRAAQKTERLVEMLDDIMDYVLLTDKSMKRERLDLATVIEESVDMMKPYADEKTITLTDRTKGVMTEKWVYGNYTFLVRAFNNLIMNAIKYNKPNGSITVDFFHEPGTETVTLKVIDTGIGVSDEDKERIFKVFERGKDSRKNVDGSIGLGLSLVKRIVEEHDGKIDLSGAPGVGTTMSITLPLVR